MAENVTTLTNPSVRTINEDSDAFFGLTLPLEYKGGSVGFFHRASTLLEQARSNIKNLLLTRKGERVAQPNFGTDLFIILFEQIDGSQDIPDRVEQAIRDAVDFWLPYVTVEAVFTSFEPDLNQVIVELTFSVNVNDEEAIDTITFEFNGVG